MIEREKYTIRFIFDGNEMIEHLVYTTQRSLEGWIKNLKRLYQAKIYGVKVFDEVGKEVN